MGALFKGVCYPSQLDAVVQQCSAASSIWGATTNLYTADCVGYTSSSYTLCVRTNGGTCTNRTMYPPTYPTCDYDAPVSLSSEYFGAVLAFLVVVLVARKLARMFWNNHESI